MKIDVSDVFENPGVAFESEQRGELEDLMFQGQLYHLENGAHIKLSYFGDEEGITVTGSLDAETMVGCDRCLKEFMYTVEFDFTEYYKESPDDTQYAFSGNTVELDKMLMDNIILNLPIKFLCDEDCMGLCPNCGNDLNEGQCGCSKQPDQSNPFYKLKSLNDNEEV